MPKFYVDPVKGIKFEEQEGLGKNPNVFHLCAGEEIQHKGMSYMDRGANITMLPLSEGQKQHFTDEFTLPGIYDKRNYVVTREVIIYEKAGKDRFKSKVIKIMPAWNTRFIT